VSEILRTSPSEHFWVGYIRCGHCDPVPGHEPRQQLIENGLQVGSAIEQVENDNRVVLLPVWASH